MKPAPPVTSALGFLVPGLAPFVATSEPPVSESCLPDGGRVEGVTAVHDELRLSHQRGGLLRIQGPHLFPLGEHDRGVGPHERLIWVEGGLDVGRAFRWGFACHRVVSYDLRPEGAQRAVYRQARRPPQVVGVRLEGEPEQGHALAVEDVQILPEFADHVCALALVHGHGGVQQWGLVLVLARAGAQSGHVFGEARPAPAYPRGEKAGPYSVVETDAVGHLGYVGPCQLAEVRDFVYKADLGRKEGVGSVLDHLCARKIRRHERDRHLGARFPLRRKALFYYRIVECPQRLESLPGVSTYHHAVGEEGVVNRATLPQELRVGADPELAALASCLVPAFAHQLGDVVDASDRHRALVDHDERERARAGRAKRPTDRARHVCHLRELGAPVGALRRADSHKEDVNLTYDRGESLGALELEASRAPGDKLCEAGLVERDPSLLEAGHSPPVVVKARHPVPDVRQRCSRRQPDVARPNDTYTKGLHATSVPYAPSGVGSALIQRCYTKPK